MWLSVELNLTWDNHRSDYVDYSLMHYAFKLISIPDRAFKSLSCPFRGSQLKLGCFVFIFLFDLNLQLYVNKILKKTC